jgi:hypothetical protein
MTTKQTEAATSDATPKEGESLVYIDLTGRKIYAKTHEEKPTKKGTQDK